MAESKGFLSPRFARCDSANSPPESLFACANPLAVRIPFLYKKSREIPFGISLNFMAESKGLLLSILYSSRCMLRVCLILHGVVPRPKNSPPDCFLNGLSNPLLTKKLRETSLRIFLLISWRRARDSNPRTVLGGYTISNRAPSTSSDNSPYLSNNY